MTVEREALLKSENGLHVRVAAMLAAAGSGSFEAEEGVLPRRKEGKNGARWIVLDYLHVIVHIFHPEEREYYNIERLWTDGAAVLIRYEGN